VHQCSINVSSVYGKAGSPAGLVKTLIAEEKYIDFITAFLNLSPCAFTHGGIFSGVSREILTTIRQGFTVTAKE